MDISFFLKGLILGFSIAAPVGPIGVLCIRRTLAFGQLNGLLSGLGAATADAFYGAVAGFGITFISMLLISQQHWLAWVGGFYLLYLGIKILQSAPAQSNQKSVGKNLVGAYLSTFILTLTNPVTILSFAAIFAGMGLATHHSNFQSAVALVLGVFVGSTLWWFTLNIITGLFRTRLTDDALRWINRISGLIICGFGVLVLISLI